MAFKVVLDANVLYPFSLRDTLLRLAERELYDLAWSDRILDEATRNLVADKRVAPAQAARLKAAMASVFPAAMVGLDAIAEIEPAMANHPGDRHVLATAVVSGAEGIVTFNARHFPDAALTPFGKQRISPDDFLCTLLDIDPLTVADSLIEQAGDLRRPPLTQHSSSTTSSSAVSARSRDGCACCSSCQRALVRRSSPIGERAPDQVATGNAQQTYQGALHSCGRCPRI